MTTLGVLAATAGVAYTYATSQRLAPLDSSILLRYNGYYGAATMVAARPILGVGPGNYITAFNRYRPLTYNQGDLWAARFTTASNFYFTALTETGLLGAAGFILLLLAIFRFLRADIKQKRAVGWGLVPGWRGSRKTWRR